MCPPNTLGYFSKTFLTRGQCLIMSQLVLVPWRLFNPPRLALRTCLARGQTFATRVDQLSATVATQKPKLSQYIWTNAWEDPTNFSSLDIGGSLNYMSTYRETKIWIPCKEFNWCFTYQLLASTTGSVTIDEFHQRASSSCKYLRVSSWGAVTCKGLFPLGCCDHSSLLESHWHKALFLSGGIVTFDWRATIMVKICN